MLPVVLTFALFATAATAQNGWLYSRLGCKSNDDSNYNKKQWSSPFNIKDSGCVPKDLSFPNEGDIPRRALWLPAGDFVGCLKKYDDRDCTKFASYMQFELRENTETCWDYDAITVGQNQEYLGYSLTEGKCPTDPPENDPYKTKEPVVHEVKWP